MGSNPISTITFLTKGTHNSDNCGAVFCSSCKWGRMLTTGALFFASPLSPDLGMYLFERSHGNLKTQSHLAHTGQITDMESCLLSGKCPPH